MKAIILAAGRGSRMGVTSENKPKSLRLFRGKSLIQWQIEALKKAGIDEIGIVTGYRAESLKSFGDYYFHNENWETTNMLFSLLIARSWLESDTCIISYSDIIYSFDIIEKLLDVPDEVAIAYDPQWLSLWSLRFDDPLDDAETFKLDKKGYLLEIGQKPTMINEIQGQYMGILKFSAHFWKNLLVPLNNPNMHMTYFLNLCINRGSKIKVVPNTSFWFEMDYPKDIKIAEILYQNMTMLQRKNGWS